MNVIEFYDSYSSMTKKRKAEAFNSLSIQERNDFFS